MTRRFVSVLGWGKSAPPHYESVAYELDGERSSVTPFVQSAIVELEARSGTPFDEVVLLGTKEVNERWMHGALTSDTALRNVVLEPAAPHRFVEVPNGRTSDELWTLFTAYTTAFGLKEPPSELVFDVTHGFRTQPMIGLSALQFALSEWARRGQAAPKVQVLYGAFDAATGVGAQRVAPVWDMTDILLVSRWNSALDALMRYGRADDIKSLAEKASVEHRASLERAGVRGPGLKSVGTVKTLGEQASLYADDLALGRLISLLRETVPALRRLLESDGIKDWVKRLPVLEGTIAALAADLAKLDRPAVGAAQATANWPLDEPGLDAMMHLVGVYQRTQRFAEMAALLRESSVVQHALDSGKPMVLDADKRSNPGIDPEYWKKTYDAVDREWGAANRESPVVALRNDIEHLGLNASPGTARGLREQLQKRASERENLQALRGPPIFLNVSNHLLSSWSPAQREAAVSLGLGEPRDLSSPLPTVDPAASLGDLETLAQTIVDGACANGRPLGAYVATEATLTLLLVDRFQNRGVRCFNATSARKVEETQLDDGALRTVREFRFVAWREYANR